MYERVCVSAKAILGRLADLTGLAKDAVWADQAERERFSAI